MYTDFSEFLKKNKTLLKEYIEVRLELFRLQGAKLLSKSLSLFIWITIVLFLVFFILLFLGVLFALWIAEISNSHIIGFASAAGVFVLLLGIVIIFRKKMFQEPVSRLIIRETLDQEDEE
ncbi:MAG: phage holin family protein [Chitinophagaceae bacterium]|nr:phage holin family protein [Chitinophagaceae bacterium]